MLDAALVTSKERKSHFNVGRITNSLGWFHQELGHFRRALELDREAAELGRHHKIGNVEVSSTLNIGGDLVRLWRAWSGADPPGGNGPTRGEGLGSHRWRWDMRVAVGIAEALLGLGRGDEALAWIERAGSTAHATGSAKYLGKCQRSGASSPFPADAGPRRSPTWIRRSRSAAGSSTPR